MALIAAAGPAFSALPQPFAFYDRGPYHQGVPRPAEVLGYQPGTFHTSYGNMERYVDALLHAIPERLRREPFGRTYEFRERALLVVGSSENLARLDAIREATARLADPRLIASNAEAERLIRETPVTVWLNYSIHGDESASFEAMAQVAYQLAAGEDSTTRAIRERCVVLLNLAHNPDGHERFVTWINAVGSGSPDPWALEQQAQQPWGIGGRTNHYQLDMNRDALAMSQIESRQMAAAFRRWRPQVVVDHHGQTASYFFPPTASPTNPRLPEREYQKWNEIFGRANARAFDRHGWGYYVRDYFDFYYPGYWDVWPTLQGAVGMTYETEGGGNLAIRRDDETLVTLRDGIERHFTASLATCATAAAHREERLRDFHRFAKDAIAEGRSGAVRAFAFEPGSDPVRAAALAENLLNADVEVAWVAKPFTATGAPVWRDLPERGSAGAARRNESARGGMVGAGSTATATRRFEHGAFVVDLAQPAGRLARTMIDREVAMDTAFARAELEKYQRNVKRGKHAPREAYGFYDLTAWSLPIAYGIETLALRELPAGGVPLAPPAPDDPRAGQERLPDSLAVGVPMTARISDGGPLELRDRNGAAVVDLTGRIDGGVARTAYVWGYDGDGAARIALRLLQEDFRIATATRPLTAGGRTYPRGSFIARVERNGDDLHERISELARTSGVRVAAVQSAYPETGDTGVGSETVFSLKAPRVAILVDGPVSPSAFGWIWFLFERRLGLRFTALRVDAVGGADLERYNVVIVPDGNAAALAAELGAGGISKLKDWVSRGGTLVCLDDAAELPTLKQVGLSSARAVGVRREEKKPDESEGAEDAESDSLSREESQRPEPLPGSVFWASLDPRHFLAYGYETRRIPVLLEGRLFLKPSKEGQNPAVFDRAPLALAGWTWPDTERRLMDTAYAIDEPSDRGHVVMIIGAPAFRLFWRGTERMLLNAVLFGPALD